jgi:hypothetical protein
MVVDHYFVQPPSCVSLSTIQTRSTYCRESRKLFLSGLWNAAKTFNESSRKWLNATARRQENRTYQHPVAIYFTKAISKAQHPNQQKYVTKTINHNLALS